MERNERDAAQAGTSPAHREAVDSESSLAPDTAKPPVADSGLSNDSTDPHEDLAREVQGLNSQVDAVLAERPLVPRPAWRKSNHRPTPLGVPNPITSGNRTPSAAWSPGLRTAVSYESCQDSPLPYNTNSRPPRDPDEAGVKPTSLRNRLMKTLDAALAVNISKYAEESRVNPQPYTLHPKP